jgi:hypothetical protein
MGMAVLGDLGVPALIRALESAEQKTQYMAIMAVATFNPKNPRLREQMKKLRKTSAPPMQAMIDRALAE